MHRFRLLALAPTASLHQALALAASRADAVGVLDATLQTDPGPVGRLLDGFVAAGRGAVGLRVAPGAEHLLAALAAHTARLDTLVVAGVPTEAAARHVQDIRARGTTVLIEVVSADELPIAGGHDVDGLVAKGSESAGRSGEETTFVLLQQALAATALPVLAHGGIGVATAAACARAGAAGAVLDGALLLTRESPLPADVRTAVARMDGSETTVVRVGDDEGVRVYWHPSATASARFRERVDAVTARSAGRAALLDELARCAGWGPPDRDVWVLGQDAALAAPLAERHTTVGRVLQAVRAGAEEQLALARRIRPLSPGAPLASAHGTRFPIVQGPMTRVSDAPEFAERVAEAGALPFVALALMRRDDVAALLAETRERLGGRPWGAGILGFVPQELRHEQLEAITACPPPFALIAGGRPDQALALERGGIATYLHVPSPALLRLFARDGARRFVFEGRECGGHTGPRASFVLWPTMVDALLEAVAPEALPECSVLLAGGIHDARSAAMAATIAAPLAARGVAVGVLLGTAYLFTHEIVATGAVVEGFQAAALNCSRTVLLETGPGHATRCAETPFAAIFAAERRRLLAAGADGDGLREELERLNLGRLRLASKGVWRRPGGAASSGAPPLVEGSGREQREQGMYMLGQVAAMRAATRSLDELHRDVSEGGSELLSATPPRISGKPRHRRRERPYDAAIVGMSCLLPGAPDLQRYWENILAKVDAVSEVPVERWDPARHYDPDPAAPDRVYSKWGGFIEEVVFDPLRYGLPPASIPSIEPLQLLALEVARAALDDAGLADRAELRPHTSVILGVGGGIGDLGHRYALRTGLPTVLEDVPADVLDGLPQWTEDSFPGVLLNVTAGRIANRLDLGGVNYIVDAACASSLAAVQLGCRELEARTSDVVLVGGADSVQNIFGYMCFAKTHALSPHGRCRPFDVAADGIAISEGLAMLVLRRLSDAERDGDRIYAVIRGVAGSSDGRHRALTAPRPEGQALALERAYAKAGCSPASVGLVEAHGTGTAAGDQAELETLTSVFGAAGARSQGCAVGSVKSMIGHTKSTAGVAGVVKAALALRHRVLPPTLNVEHPNTAVRSAESPFYVNTEARAWPQDPSRGPRRAAVSAFGFGGTNFHAVIEEHAADAGGVREAPRREWPAELLTWSGDDAEEILAEVEQLAAALQAGARPVLRDLSLTLWKRTCRGAAARLALTAGSSEELEGRLRTARSLLESGGGPAADRQDVWLGTGSPDDLGEVAVLFPGQGAQTCGMLQDLTLQFPELSERYEQANAVLADRLPVPLSTLVFPPPAFDDEERHAREQALRKPDSAQPALGAAGMGCWQLLRALGVRAGAVAGHSYGEYVALAAAGAIEEETLYALSEARGRAITEAADGDDLGTMAAAAADDERVAALLRGVDGVTIANRNSPRQTVVSGTSDSIAHALQVFEEAGVAARRLPVACAFHSPLVAPAAERLAAVLETVDFKAPEQTVYANGASAPYPRDGDAVANRLVRHLVEPVDFVRQVEAMYAAGVRVLIEAGPRQTLTGLVDEILAGRPHLAVAIDRTGRGGLAGLLHALGALFAHGVAMDLDRLFAGRGAQELRLETLAHAAATPVPAGAWLVDGGSARPAGAEKPRTRRSPAVLPTPIEPLPPSAPVPALPHGNGVPAHLADGSADDVLERFERLMDRFLDTQRAVMDRYFDAADGRPDSPPPADRPPTEAAAERAVEPVISAAPVIPDTEPIAPGSFRDAVVAVVSDRTGYPPEALVDDVNLEADLGIDSIKKVEIVATLRGTILSAAEFEDGTMERLTSQRTLGGLVTAVSALAGGGADQGDTAAVAPAVQEAPEPDELPIAAPARQIGRVLPELVDAPIGPGQDLAGRRVLVTDPGGAVAEHVVALLQQAGAHAVRLCAADLADDAATAVQRARPVDAVVHLLALGTPSGATWDDRIALETRTLVSVLQAAAEDLCRDGRGRVLAATALGRREDGDLAGTSQAAITGLLRSLAHEWPDTAICAVHLDLTQDAAVLAAQIRDELCAAEPEREITYTGGRRRATRLRPAALDGGPPRLSLDEKAVVLVTGGARGITALAARAIARRWRPRLVLVGRTPWPEPEDPALAHVDDERELKRALMERLGTASLAEVDAAYRRLRDQREMRTTVRDIEAAGARVQYREVDVRDPVAVAALIAEFDRLDVVVHGAGVIEDRRFVQKSWDSFERVLATKAGGALNLSRQLDARSLQAFVLFASTAGRLGNAGQCDYAAANAVLDELAARLDADWPGRVVAIDWGPWKVGMTTPEVLRRFAAQRVEAIEPDQGVRALLEELEHGRKGEPEVVLGNGPWSRQLPLVTGDGAIRRNGRVELMRVLDTASDRFLRDHCLDGRPVLPAAVALEALAELAQHERPSRQVWAVEGLQVLRGVVLDAPTARLTIAAEGLEVGPDHRGEERLTLSIGGPGEVTQHYRATALIADRLPQAPAHVPAEGLQPFPASVEEAYSRWLFQGSSLQGISALHGISDTCVAATLRASTPEQLVAASAGRWLFDPVVIDSAFQLVILWARLHVDMTPLPAEIAAVRRFAAELPAEVRCELRVAPSGGGHVLDTDFTFTDDRGRVVLQVAGMRFICRRELNRVATAAGREPAP